MSWMKILYDTYDQNEGEIANFKRENYLCPIAHMIVSSQIEITVDIQGEFQGASQITNRGDAEIIIPATDAVSYTHLLLNELTMLLSAASRGQGSAWRSVKIL